jgi:DNA-binding transcriptional MerR regulator
VSDPSGRAAADPEGAGSGRRPIYSIGAVAKMLGVEPATLRAWEERYGVVVPTRSEGAQRVFSRDELERLRFIVNAMEGGATAAEAHRLLGEQLRRPELLTRPDAPAVTIVVLLAERDRYAAELCEYFLRTEGYDVCLAFDSTGAERLFVERMPGLAVVELMISGGGLELCRQLARVGVAPVLAVSALNLADVALAAGASAYLPKPFEPLQFVSTVRDLLGASALTRRAGAEIC